MNQNNRKKENLQRNMNRNQDYNPRKHSYKSSATASSSQSNPNNSYNENNHRNSNWNHNQDRPNSNSSSSNVVSPKVEHNGEDIIGTCPFMCPEKERSQRERLRDLATFERLHGNPSKSSPTLAVKKFCRTISTKDVQATDLRPLPVLEDTLNYLMELLDSSDQPFEIIHDFIFDRTRSIRQDLGMQNINDKVICMYEKMVRFHIISHHKLRRCEGDSMIISSIHHLNKEQLTKCLASLYNLYDVNRTSDCIFENEAEFRSLYVLLHLDPQSHPTVSSNRQFLAFLCTVAAEATYLQFYIIEPYINQVWERALECVNFCAYKLHPYPLASLSNILMIKELDLEAFCNACGLDISEDDIGNKVLPTKHTGFRHPKGRIQSLDSSLLDLLGK